MHRYADMLFTLCGEQAGPFCSELWQHLISAQERDVIEGVFDFKKLLRESYVELEMSTRYRTNEHFQGYPKKSQNTPVKHCSHLSYGYLAGEPGGSTKGVHRPKEGQTLGSGAS